MTMILKTTSAFGDKKELLEIEVDWTSSTGGASTTSTADNNFMTQTISEIIKGRYAIECQTVPHATAPTASYDIVINDHNSEDIMDGGLANRSATASESVFPAANSVNAVVPITGDLSFVVSNAGDTKRGKIRLLIE